MNSIAEINRINQRELELGVAGNGSWHDQYKDSAYVFVGGLAYELTEGDVITIFSQWGEIADVNLPRDKVTGKTKGFGFVMYEDQRSTVMAVDNMNGASVLSRTIRVDHCRQYHQPGTRNEEGDYVEPDAPSYNALPAQIEASDSESSASDKEDPLDEEDPMAAFLRAEKKKSRSKDGKKRKRKHEGETKEERKARKEAKRTKKGKKERLRVKDEPAGEGTERREKRVKVEEHDEGARDGRDRRDGDNGKDGRDGIERRDDLGAKARADREDWRQGRWEMEEEEKKKDKTAKTGNGDRPDEDRRDREGRDRYGGGDPDRSRTEDRERYESRDDLDRWRGGEGRYGRR